MRWLTCIALLPAAVFLTSGAGAAETDALGDGLFAVFHLERGSIVTELEFETVPLTVTNFVGLAEGTIPNSFRRVGEPFYSGLKFHRVVPGFVAQGGDPLGTGEGDPGYEFADEFSPRLKHDAAGVLAMANGGPNTNGCQFYLTLAPVNRLNYKHTVFGRVVAGREVLQKIEQGDVIDRIEIRRVGERALQFRPSAESFARLRETTPRIPPRDPALPPLFANEAGVALPPWYAPWINEKLHHYAAVNGITIFVRIIPRMVLPDAVAENGPLHPLRFAHEQLAGADPNAATLLLVVNEKRWRLWLADGLLERCGLTPAIAATAPGSAQLQALKQDILRDAKPHLAEGTYHRSVDAAVTRLTDELDRFSSP